MKDQHLRRYEEQFINNCSDVEPDPHSFRPVDPVPEVKLREKQSVTNRFWGFFFVGNYIFNSEP